MSDIMFDVIKILESIHSRVNPDNYKNERYLHHDFSNELCKKGYNIDRSDFNNTKLHPEWASSRKENSKFSCGKYKYNKDKKIYEVDEKGSSGFIDFVIGRYTEPDLAIEFTTGFGLRKEAIIFDMMKIMDKRNKFLKCISYNLVFRKREVSEKDNFSEFQATINSILEEYKNRLGGFLDKDKEYLFWIIEIGRIGKIRSWYNTNSPCCIPNESPEHFEECSEILYE